MHKYYYRKYFTRSTKMNIQAILFGSAVLTVVHADCQTTAEGYTWSFQADRDDMLLDIPSAEACLSSCFHNSECLGYTWFVDQVVNICYLFHVLEDLHDCRECHSKTVPKRIDGEYFNLDPDFLIGVVGENSAEDCFQSCVDTDGCVGYTWYGLDSLFPMYCFKYSDHTSTAPCQGCSSGVMSCIDSLPSSTQTPTTSVYQDQPNALTTIFLMIPQEILTMVLNNIVIMNLTTRVLTGMSQTITDWKPQLEYRYQLYHLGQRNVVLMHLDGLMTHKELFQSYKLDMR